MLVCQQMCEKIIEMFKYSVPQRRIGMDLDILSSSVHNINKSFKESGGISVHKEQGSKPKLTNRALRCLRRHCIKNHMGSGLLLANLCQALQYVVTATNVCYNFTVPKGSLMLTVSRSAVDFSGLEDIWDGP